MAQLGTHLTLVVVLMLCMSAGGRRKPSRLEVPPKEIHVAGLFMESEWQEMIAFQAAVDRINNDNQILPNIHLVPMVEVFTSIDSFITGKRVCNITRHGVGAIFGPNEPEIAGIVSSICDTLEIPHILTHWDTSLRPTNGQVNLYPDPKNISQALVDLLEDMSWKTFTIIYENDIGLVRLQEVLKVHGPQDAPITVRQLDDTPAADDEEPDYRILLKEIQNTSESHIVLDVDADKLLSVFRQAMQVKMMGDYTSYLVTSLDAHTLDFAEINKWIGDKQSLVNITGVRLIDPQSIEVQNALQDWIHFERHHRNKHLDIKAEQIKVSSALIYDAVYVFAKALHGVAHDDFGNGEEGDDEIQEEPIPCDNVYKWRHGLSIMNYMKLIKHKGVSGPIEFDETGRRSFFNLTLVEINTGNATGTWDPRKRIHLFRSQEEMDTSTMDKLSKKVMRVVSRIGDPYLKKRENYTEGMGNDGLEGYSMDLIDHVAKILNFSYEFYLVKDGKYGSLDPISKQWDGIIKDLLDRKADLGICDLTITYDRERAVDFTMPFMTLGISILYSKPTKEDPNLFSFLSPLSVDVWIYMATAYLGVSLLLFVLARTSPYEWDNPHPCNPDPEELENTFTLVNSLWFSMGSLLQQGCDFLPKTTPNEWANPHPCKEDPDQLENMLTMNNSIWHNCGSLMQQGSDIAPQAISTRMVAGMWWFFTLIMISSYTANLAAFLTVTRLDVTIKDAKELAFQTKIKYGAVDGGSTKSFFQNSNFSVYQRMWAAMESARPSVFTKDNKEGVERVMTSKRSYAFLMESTSIEYEVERHCELQQVGSLLDSKGYGIAMPKNSPYRTLISGAVLKLQEEGKLTILKNKWWKEMYGGGSCEGEDDSGTDASALKLGMGNLGGVFVVLIFGCVVAFLVSVAEFLWNTRKVAIDNKVSLKEAFLMEIRFAIQCSGSTKPAKPKGRTPDSNASQSLVQLDSFPHITNNGKK